MKRNDPVIVNGVQTTFEEFCKQSGLQNGTVEYRLKKGWTPEEILSTPPRIVSSHKAKAT